MKITIITDASWCPEMKVAGYGFWVATQRGKVGGGGSIKSDGIPSANVAEMMAVVNGLAAGIANGLVLHGDEILMQTDCMAAIDAFTGRREIRCPLERGVIAKLQETVRYYCLQMSYKHVKGHTGKRDARSVTNHLCDRRAKDGMHRARNVARLRTRSDLE